MLASELFARSQNSVNSGKEWCYWCGSSATEEHLHDDAPPIPFQKRHSLAARPSEPWICEGCYLWRRPSTTVRFLLPEDDKVTKPFKDRQCAVKHSWLVTSEPLAVIFESYTELYRRLLSPPKTFFLSMLTDKSIPNHLQKCIVNDNQETKADTVLWFTIDNIPHTYTVYELTEALQNGTTGKEPGVRELCRLLGAYSMPAKSEPVRGRPKEQPDGKVTKRRVG